MQRRADIIYADQLAPGRASYAQAVRVGDLLFVSDQQGVDAQGRLVGPGEIRAQTQQALVNLRTVLQLAGLGLEDVVKTTVFLQSMDDFTLMNEIYARYFPASPPARSTVEVARLPRGAKVEIEAVAVLQKVEKK